jgi:hypothetical protein
MCGRGILPLGRRINSNTAKCRSSFAQCRNKDNVALGQIIPDIGCEILKRGMTSSMVHG